MVRDSAKDGFDDLAVRDGGPLLGRPPGLYSFRDGSDTSRVTRAVMGFYSDHIFPRLMESGLKGELQRKHRRRALSRAHGQVLEIGFGTGLNLDCYPEGVVRVVGLDSVSLLEKRTMARIACAPFPVQRVTRDAAERLPFHDGEFDTVVSTWTLCSIGRLRSALEEMRRVLAPGAALLFLEHGRSDRRWVARVQDRINPVQNIIGCGCNLNRKIDEEIEGAGFEIAELDRFTMPGVPRALGSIYLGVARGRDDDGSVGLMKRELEVR